MERSRAEELKAVAPIDSPTINRLDEVFEKTLSSGKNIAPDVSDAIYDDYFKLRTAINKDRRRGLPENMDEFGEAVDYAQSVILDKLKFGAYPSARAENSFLLDAEVLRKEQVEAAFKAVREAAKSTVISRGGLITFSR